MMQRLALIVWLTLPLALPPEARAFGAAEPALGVTELKPHSGPADQDIPLRLEGNLFEEGMTVTLGTIPLTEVTLITTVEATATLPAGSLVPGVYDLEVTTPSGASELLPGAFEVTAAGMAFPPSVESVLPLQLLKGETLTVTGRFFDSGCTVELIDQVGGGTTVLPDPQHADTTSIDVVVPEDAFNGLYVVRVTHPDGQSDDASALIRVGPVDVTEEDCQCSSVRAGRSGRGGAGLACLMAGLLLLRRKR